VRISVAFGRVDPEQALRCLRCRGEGKAAICYGSTTLEQCPRCHGDGLDPHPRVYGYRADQPLAIGDVVLVPVAGYRSQEPLEATVVKLTSDYCDSPLRSVIAVLEGQS
jgi:hypothetical protein